MKKWISENKKATTMIVSVALFLGIAMTVQGCGLQKMVKFEVPAEVSTAIDVDQKQTLAEAQDVWEDWQAYVEKNSKRLSRSIEDANKRFELISSITEMGLSVAKDNASIFPGGAMLVSGLTLMTGLFLKRPGEDKKVQLEKEQSFKAGLKEAIKNGISGKFKE